MVTSRFKESMSPPRATASSAATNRPPSLAASNGTAPAGPDSRRPKSSTCAAGSPCAPGRNRYGTASMTISPKLSNTGNSPVSSAPRGTVPAQSERPRHILGAGCHRPAVVAPEPARTRRRAGRSPLTFRIVGARSQGLQLGEVTRRLLGAGLLGVARRRPAGEAAGRLHCVGLRRVGYRLVGPRQGGRDGRRPVPFRPQGHHTVLTWACAQRCGPGRSEGRAPGCIGPRSPEPSRPAPRPDCHAPLAEKLPGDHRWSAGSSPSGC